MQWYNELCLVYPFTMVYFNIHGSPSGGYKFTDDFWEPKVYIYLYALDICITYNCSFFAPFTITWLQ